MKPRVFAFYALAGLTLLAYVLSGPSAGVCMAAVTVVSGARATAGTQGIDSNSRVIDMSDTIHVLDPNTAPLMSLTNKLRKARCVNPKFEWLEDEYLPTSAAVSGTVTNSGTSIVVASGKGGYFRKGDVIKSLATGEVIFVSSVSSDTLTVIRGIGSSAINDLGDTTTLLIIGNANQEGATGRDVKSSQKNPMYNYTQIFRWPYGITGTLDNSELYGGNDFAYQARKGGVEHKKQIEASFLFGERAEATTAVKGGDGKTPIRYTGGFFEKVTTNVTTQQTLSMSVLETFIRTGFRYGGTGKLLFASRPIMSYINQIAVAKIQALVGDKSFPLVLSEYLSPHGKLYLIEHRQLEGTGANNQAYQGWAALVDMDSVWYRYLQNRDTKVRTNIQANDVDGRQDEYISECGLMTIQTQHHSVLNNVQAFS